MSSAPYPAAPVVRAFVIIGVFVALLGAATAWKLVSLREQEMLRYIACSQGSRTDCEPSLFWVLAGIAKNDADGRIAADLDPSPGTGKRVVRTSDQAPLLTSLKPEGFVPDAGGYRVDLRATTTLTATVERAERVEARLRVASSTEPDTLVAALAPVAGKEGVYEATFAWAEPRSGELEIRAYGSSPDERASLFLPLRVETVAKRP